MTILELKAKAFDIVAQLEQVKVIENQLHTKLNELLTEINKHGQEDNRAGESNDSSSN
jgi:hypothetical protein